jgi:hypothetical protein
MSSANESLHKQKHSLVPGGALAVEEIAVQSGALTDDKSTQMISNSICSDNTSLDVQISQAEHHSKEDLAATVVQSAFRAFLVCYLFKNSVPTDIH